MSRSSLLPSESNPALARGFSAYMESSFDVIRAERGMTIAGTVGKTFLFLLLTTLSAVLTFRYFALNDSPTWIMWVAMGGALIVALVICAKPKLASSLGIVYALLEGALLGIISLYMAYSYGTGLVLEAVLLTFLTALVMLALYSSRVIRATPRFRKIVILATVSILLFYVFSWIASLLHLNFLGQVNKSPFGLIFSVVVVIIAALNLVLDYDMVERGVAARAPRYMEWYAAFGLTVTLIWLYLSILRMLARINRS